MGHVSGTHRQGSLFASLCSVQVFKAAGGLAFLALNMVSVRHAGGDERCQ
jgi:hypothetical protein